MLIYIHAQVAMELLLQKRVKVVKKVLGLKDHRYYGEIEKRTLRALYRSCRV